MNSEESRLRTFSGWPENAPVDFKRIAKAGFYYMGQGLEVQCFSCGSRISEWNYADKVMARHKALDPRCPFVLNPHQSGNVPARSAAPSASGSTSFVPLPPRHVREAPTLAGSGDDSAPYHDEAVRLASFDEWPIPSVVSPAKLAAAGFYYTNFQSKVVCAYCDGAIVHWNPGDDPELIHQKCYPTCDFINDRLKYRIFPYTNITIRDPVRITESSELEALKSLGVYYHRIPKNPKFATVEARLRSFHKWPPLHNQVPEVLAEAGFYYTGIGDKVRCFHCDGGLKEWKKNDVPWAEHAKWFSDCTFLTMVKGPEFVQEVLQTLPEALKEEMETSPRTLPREGHPLTDHALQSLMSSPAAVAALEMGIEASRVKCALRQKLSSSGTPYQDWEADVLIFACMDIQSEENSSSGYDERSSVSPILPRRVFRTRERVSPEVSDDTDADEAPPPQAEKKAENAAVVPPEIKEPKKQSDDEVSLEEENRLLKEARLCKVCLDREVVIVFLPCAHLATCSVCSQSLKDCPLCRQSIKATVRTFLS